MIRRPLGIAVILAAALAAPATARAPRTITFANARLAVQEVVDDYLAVPFTEHPARTFVRCRRVTARKMTCQARVRSDRLNARFRATVRLDPDDTYDLWFRGLEPIRSAPQSSGGSRAGGR